MLKDPKELRAALNGYAKFLVNQSKANLKQSGKVSSGNLLNSIKKQVSPTVVPTFELSILAEDYAKFVDQGVQGVTSSKAPNSPYKFGTGSGAKGGLTNSIEKWVKRKGLRRWRDEKTGRFISHNQIARRIIRSIWNKGIAPTMFMTKAVNQVMKYLPDDILKAYALDLEGQIYNDIKNQKINLNG